MRRLPPSDRGEIPENEDMTDISPSYLISRKPTLAFVALLAILDPPREEVIEAVKIAHTAGICVKMITGKLYIIFLFTFQYLRHDSQLFL